MKKDMRIRLAALLTVLTLVFASVFAPGMRGVLGAEDADGSSEVQEAEHPSEEQEAGEMNEDEATTPAADTKDRPVFDGVIKPVSGDTTEEMSTVEIAEHSTPAVVAIMTLVQTRPVWGSPQTAMNSGSGVILTPDGHIVTNSHVVEGASSVMVRLANGEEFTAEIVARDTRTDLAVLKIDGKDLPYMSLTDSSEVKVGEMAIAIGNPLGELEGTVTRGIVSGLDRTVSTRSDIYSPVNVIEGVIQTDAAINRGNSGGALVNSKGKLMGINVAKPAWSGTTVVEGIGFAIPSNIVADIVNQLLDRGYVGGRPYLGIQPVNVNHQMQYYYSMPAGAYVRTVLEGTAAEKGGIQVSDIITKVNGETINTASDLQQILNRYAAGDEIELEIWRAGLFETITLTLDERAPRPMDTDMPETAPNKLED